MQRHPKRYEISKDELAYLNRPVLSEDDRRWFAEMSDKYAESMKKFFARQKEGK